MYLDFYQLKQMPFDLRPDRNFLWLGPRHEQVLSVLRHGVVESMGFIVITGAPGTGKSTLLEATIASLGRDFRVVRIPDPGVDEIELFKFTATALEMPLHFRTKGDFLIELAALVQQDASRRLLLIVDEAQRLSPELLEQIRLLSNMEDDRVKRVSSIFAGQPEFLKLARQNRAFRQRIFYSCVAQPLTLPETSAYIAHRLLVAGRKKPIFTPAALVEIFNLTSGVPALVNLLCDHALLNGYALNRRKIKPALVCQAAESTLIPHREASRQKRGPLIRMAGKRPVIYTLAAMIVLALVIIFYRMAGLP